MSSLIDKATMVVNYLLIALILGAVVGIIIFFIYKKRKKNKVMADGSIDYSMLERKNAQDYIKFEDICDDMIVTDNGRRFIGAIRCKGVDFYSAHIAEKYSIQAGYVSFIKTISGPTTYRQYTQTIDMEKTDKRYIAALNKRKEVLYNLEEDHKAYQGCYDQGQKDGSSGDELEMFEHKLETLKKLMDTEKWHIYHLEDQLLYSGQIGGMHAIPKRNETYVFEWTYNPFESPVELSQTEIHKKAIRELIKIGDSKIHALSQSKVKAYRCKTQELIEMCRRHTNPVSAERFKMSDIKNSTYYDDITTTDQKDVLEKECMEEFAIDVMRGLQDEFQSGSDIYTDVGQLSFETGSSTSHQP